MTVSLEEEATVSRLKQELGCRFPALKALAPVLSVAVNQEYRPDNTVLRSEDEVAVLALDPFSIVGVEQGRSTHPMIHYSVAGGGALSAKVNHPMVVVMKWIAEGRKNAYSIQLIKRGEQGANATPKTS